MWLGSMQCSFYERYVEFCLQAYCAWMNGFASAVRPESVVSGKKQGCVIWAAERFTGKRRSVANRKSADDGTSVIV